MRYLMSIAVGPVQGFIEAARKTRDLYAGSWILSEVAKAVAAKLAGGTLIFPAAGAAELSDPKFAAVNKILAVVDTENPEGLAEELKKIAMGKLTGLEGRMRNPHSLKFDRRRLLSHLEGFLEFCVAWIPYDGNGDYDAARTKAEQLMNARKALNGFGAHAGIPGMRKCSLDGGCETVIADRGDTSRDLIRLREKEELDGPGLLKRFLDIEPRFESTLEAAALPYVRKVERLAAGDDGLKTNLESLRAMNKAAGLRTDSGELLFEYESRKIFKNEPDQLRELERLREAVHKRAGRPDPAYYALMAADGDSMGDALNGLSMVEHQASSRNLSEFSRSVRTLLDGDCMTIFAGGDDVLAVLPLHRLRKAAWAVRAAFQKVRAGKKRVTMSAGIAVVHALEPLSEVRETANDAKRDAKAVDGKDAVSIVVQPRSGAPVRATGKWEDMGKGLEAIVGALREDRLSFGFAHELRQLLDGTPRDLDDVLPDMARALAKKKEKEKKEDSAAKKLVKDMGDREELKELVERMLVARKIARAEEDAEGGAA